MSAPWKEAVDWVVQNKQFAYVDPDTGKRLETPDSVFEVTEEDREAAAEANNDPKGVILDMFSASVIQQVYSVLKPKNKEKFEKLPLLKAQQIALKVMRR
jgi:hypothetical protein